VSRCEFPPLPGSETGLILSFVFHAAFLNYETKEFTIGTSHMDVPEPDACTRLGCSAGIVSFNSVGTVTLGFTGTNPWMDADGLPIGISDAARAAAKVHPMPE
jgi:hypothetical protein